MSVERIKNLALVIWSTAGGLKSIVGCEHGLVVGCMDLLSAGPGFKSSSLPLQVDSVARNSTPTCFVNSQLFCLLPVGIFNKFLLDLKFLSSY